MWFSRMWSSAYLFNHTVGARIPGLQGPAMTSFQPSNSNLWRIWLHQNGTCGNKPPMRHIVMDDKPYVEQ